MHGIVTSRLRGRFAALCGGALLLTGLLATFEAPAAGTATAAAAPGTARIWFYRDYEPYGGKNYAPVKLNGTLVGHARPEGGAFYRDVPAGHYQISVLSDGTDVNQSRDVDLTAGAELYVKILSAPNWESGGDTSMYRRDTYYLSVIPPQIARSELPSHPLTGG